jgi:DNA-binding HxlR family transcriptional regulator
MNLSLESAGSGPLGGKRTGCPIDAALTSIGNRTSFLVLREAFYGTRRFDDFVERLGMTDAAVSPHLRSLTAAGLLERAPYREEGQRLRYEYQLTPKGADLLPVMLALLQWTEKHLWHDRSGLEIVETATGEPVEVRICAGRGPSLSASDITLRPRR